MSLLSPHAHLLRSAQKDEKFGHAGRGNAQVLCGKIFLDVKDEPREIVGLSLDKIIPST